MGDRPFLAFWKPGTPDDLRPLLNRFYPHYFDIASTSTRTNMRNVQQPLRRLQLFEHTYRRRDVDGLRQHETGG